MAEDAISGDNQYVVFRLGREVYGLEISTVLEIITMQAITEVPGTEDYIEGVINLRGLVIPVFNMHKRFNLPGGETTRLTRVVVVEVEGNNIGMLVDGVSEVIRIPSEIIEPPSNIMNGINEEYLLGIAKLDDRLVILLDLTKVLRKEDTSKLDSFN
ncbi:chemotaxis protein CheW [Phosphitispora sp. TUW77]|uniref:chemotaxis protein CheW n=1 Tax=Phosphitispora sp. TUW77 TaxID=3152361 RepID=UPI003AB45158